jgi:hypothetical protein
MRSKIKSQSKASEKGPGGDPKVAFHSLAIIDWWQGWAKADPLTIPIKD